MEDPRSDSLNELVANFSEEEFARLKEHVERRDRATAAPMERAPSTRIGMFLPRPYRSCEAVRISRLSCNAFVRGPV